MISSSSQMRSTKCLLQMHSPSCSLILLDNKVFAVQDAALQEFHASTKAWAVEPKMHQFLEMCSSSSKPNMSWTYRDERLWWHWCSALQDQGRLLEKGAGVWQENVNSS